MSEIAGLDVVDLYFPDGRPRVRLRLRREIAKGGRAGDVFLPDALGLRLERFWGYKLRAGEFVVSLPEPPSPAFGRTFLPYEDDWTGTHEAVDPGTRPR